MPPKPDPTAISVGEPKHTFYTNVFAFEVMIAFQFKPCHVRILFHFSLLSCCSPVCLRAVGGEVGATAALAPKLGPLGLVGLLLFLFITY